ncbi:hypothetical protein ACLOJK_019035 [Asimina triloba]
MKKSRILVSGLEVWMYADQNRSGFLGRAEFYNALRLVTVAQSGRELTQDIVRAALGPAAAKIPAPQISTAPMPSVTPPGPRVNSGVQPNSQMHAVAPTSSQNLGLRAPSSVLGAGMSQQFFPSSDNQSTRPAQPMPATSLPLQGASQGLPGAGNMAGPHAQSSNMSNVSADWLSARPSGVSAGVPSQVPNRGTPPSVSHDGFGLTSGPTASLPPRPQSSSGQTSSLPPRPPTPALPSAQPSAKDPKPLAGSANGFASDSMFGGDVFSAIPSQPKPGSSTPTVVGSGMPTSSTIVPAATGSQPSVKLGLVDPRSMLVPSTGNNQLQQAPKPQAKQTHLGTSALAAVGTAGPTSNESQVPWPRITPSAIQKYNKVFVEVDKDRDGKITGEEARNLFLSWRLPREVLKQVWDLSDQDNDSMLSLREFCTALYLMERYREGRPLPSVLPNSVRFDETLLRITGQPNAAYGGAWQPAPGLPPQGMPGARPVSPTTGLKPSPQVAVPSQNDGEEPPVQPKSRVPVLEKHLVSQLSKEEQDALNTKFQEATEAEKKVAAVSFESQWDAACIGSVSSQGGAMEALLFAYIKAWRMHKSCGVDNYLKPIRYGFGLGPYNDLALLLDLDKPGISQSRTKINQVRVLLRQAFHVQARPTQSSAQLSSAWQFSLQLYQHMEELEKEILESKEKIEFYRAKMQELVLYKSRCDNRLNEVTERSYTDKREVESLAKKYEEKYRQTGDVASKLTIEEATFRDIQKTKMEIYNAIVRMEQGKTADGVLQVRAEQIQSDLEELVKALNERCKSYGLRAKPTALVELPFVAYPRKSAPVDLNRCYGQIRVLMTVGNLEFKRQQLIGMKIGINLKMKASMNERKISDTDVNKPIAAFNMGSVMDNVKMGLAMENESYDLGLGLLMIDTVYVKFPLSFDCAVCVSFYVLKRILGGFVLVKELSVDVENIVAPPRTKPTYKDKSSDENFEIKPSTKVDDKMEKPVDNKTELPVDNKMEKPSSPVEQVSESSRAYTKSKDDSARSPPGSPAAKAAHESSSQEFLAPKFDKNVDADSSPHGKESYRKKMLEGGRH